MSIFKKTLSIVLALVMALSVFSVAVSAASDFTVDGEDPIATLTLDTDTLTVNPGDEIVVAAYLTTNFYAASYTIPFWFSKNLFSPVGAELNVDSPYANYAKFAFNANLNTTLTKNQFGTKTLAWTANPVLAANSLTVADITKDNFQNYFYYATCGFTPNSQIGSQAEVMDNSPIVDYTFKVADDAAPGTVGVIWLDQSYGWATNNTSGIMKIAAFKDGAGKVGTATTACYTDVSSDAARLVFTVAGTAEPEADKTELEAAIATLPSVSQDIATSASWTAYIEALGVAQTVFADDTATQDEIDEAKNALLAAINNVAELGFCDYTELNRAIALYEQFVTIKDQYTEESWARYAAAYIDAVSIEKNLRDDEAGENQGKIAAATEALNNAHANLELAPLPDADYTRVEEAIASIPEDLTIYTDESVAELQTAVDSVEYGLDITMQQIVDGYAATILAAIEALELKPVEPKDADYTSVEEAIASIPEELSIYTDESVAALNAAVEAVVYGLKEDEQERVDTFAADIFAAIKALELKPVELEDADYTAVEEAIASIPEDLSIYTDESVAALQTAVDAVVYGLKEDEQERVDAFAADILAAIEALELKPVAPAETNVINVVAVEGGYDVTVKGSPEKVQFIGEGTTRTYTRESAVVTIREGEDGTEIWTVAIYLPRADYEAIARFNKVWDEEGFEFTTIVPLDEVFYSIEAEVEGYEAVYTVKTGIDVQKIQIVDNGMVMTLASGYEDIDGVRVWTVERAVTKGDHDVFANYKTVDGWKTGDMLVEFTATLTAAE